MLTHTVYSAENKSVPAKRVYSFVGWDSQARAITHANVLANAVVNREFSVVDDAGLVVYRAERTER